MNAVAPQSSAETGAGLPYLPVFLDVRDQTVLLIGGGSGTPAKLDLLRRAGACVRLVTPHLDSFLRQRVLDDRLIEVLEEPVGARHFERAIVAVDASGDPAINQLSQRLARAAGIPLNVVDRPALCNFVFPAILDRAPVIVAISTGGMAPAIARLIRQRLETAIPAGIGRLAVLASRFRAVIAQRLPSHRQATRFWEQLFEGDAARLALDGRMDDAGVLAESLIAELEADCDAPSFQTLHVTSDDPELLTVRAARMLKAADVIIHDPSIGIEILGLARRDARRFALHPCEARDTALEETLRRHAGEAELALYLKANEIELKRPARGCRRSPTPPSAGRFPCRG
jgi:uroporphyrin-III C-methyltransferase / precorrin-2 dehydrogenase / sirohydrochlorin ferrochelatase